MRHDRRRILIAAAAVGLVLAVLLVSGLSQHHRRQAVADRVNQIKATVPIGVSEDELRTRLEAAGFRVGECVRPYATAEYCDILVPVSNSLPSPAATAEYVVTGGNKHFGGKSWVVIRLDLNGHVVSVE